MNILKVKKSIILLVGMIAITALGGIAQAETRFAVQDPTGTTDKMVVTDTGFVGVGTNTPGSAISLKGATPETTRLNAESWVGTSTTPSNASAGIIIMRSRADGTLPIATDRLGYILFGSNDPATTPATGRYSAGFFAYADGTWTSTSTPSYYVFETTQAGHNYRDEWMRITSSGKIGVNTNVPKAQLEVNGGLRLNATAVAATSTSSSRPAPAKPACDATNGPIIRGTLWFTNGGTSVADILQICSKDANGAYQWRNITFN